jgi:arginyl-tRNA synthetase
MTANPHLAAVYELLQALAERAQLAVKPEEVSVPEPTHGDLAIPCFRLASEAKASPADVARRIADTLNAWVSSQPTSIVAQAAAAGPYVNVRLNRRRFAAEVLGAIEQTKEAYGASVHGAGQRVVLEYVSPNTNKPLHLGHLRNAFLGWSVVKLLQLTGYEVVKTAVINDRGIHIMKSLLAYQRWSEMWDGKKLTHETPRTAKLKGDAFVGKYYVLYASKAKDDATLDDEAQELLRRWEQGDGAVRTLWKKLNAWALKGHDATYERIGVSFDKLYFESDLFAEGRDVVNQQLAAGAATKRPDGSVTIDLTAEGLGEKVLLRADGTTVYITQDLALAKRRITDFNPQLIVYVVGQEQDHQFRALFATLRRFGIGRDVVFKHLSYHLVSLPEGRMKSREGTVVDADDLLDQLTALALDEVRARHGKLLQGPAKRRAEAIALAAVKYFFLKVRPSSDIRFDPQASLQFTGRTGPYLLYTYARVASIFKKERARGATPPVGATVVAPLEHPAEPTAAEWPLLLALGRFPARVEQAALTYDPSLLADYGYDLAKAMNDFYEAEPVLQAEPALRTWRLELLTSAQLVLGRCLTLMGIPPLEEM